jgi:hypothetical protein
MLPQVPRKLFVDGIVAPAEIPKRKNADSPMWDAGVLFIALVE